MKNIGITTICITPMNDCICLIRTAIITPNAVIANASASCRTKIPRISSGSYGTWTSPARQITITPWKLATVAPPRHLPITIELRRTGATIISRRNPNSRSHTIEAAENIAVNITEMQRIPG